MSPKTAAFIFRGLSPLFVLLCGAATAAGTVRVQSFAGTAEILSNGEWRQLQGGETLEAGVSLRAGADSRLQLELPDNSFFRLTEGSACRIIESKSEKKNVSLRLELETGTLIVSTAGANARIEIIVPDGGKFTGKGLFSVTAVGDDAAVLSVLKGEACLADGKKDVCAKKQQDLRAAKAEQPGKPGKMTDSSLELWKRQKFLPPSGAGELFLKVIRPEEGRCHDQPEIFVVGNTLPGAAVRVNGNEMKVRQNGEFSGSVNLFEGENRLNFTAIAREGETLSVVRTVCLDTTPPLLTVSQPPDNFDPTQSGSCSVGECRILIFGLTEPGVLLIINGVDVSRFIQDDGSFLIQDFPVRMTDTTLTVQAYDSLRRTTYDIIQIQSPVDSDGDGAYDFLDACPLDPQCK
ncbi:MAG: FecR domain-containing protein [bacterium]